MAQRVKTEGLPIMASRARKNADTGFSPRQIQVTASMGDLQALKVGAQKPNPEADAETERIRERSKTPEAQKPHKFQPAKWTHPNGHPRCLICGDEETEGGMGPGLKEEK